MDLPFLITIAVDGACLGNGFAGARAGAAAVIVYPDERWQIAGEWIGAGTNQQAEIIAAALGLEQLREPQDVLLLSDSQYVIKTMRGEWKRKTNYRFWNRLDIAAHPHRVNWQWVRGHSGHKLNDAADYCANRIAIERGWNWDSWTWHTGLDPRQMLLKDLSAQAK